MKENNDSTNIITYLIVLLAILFINPLIIKLAWNAVIPTIFNFTTITYWQVFALDILCASLFSYHNVSAKETSHE